MSSLSRILEDQVLLTMRFEIPYAEPPWLVPNFHSPYYNDSHRRLQKSMRVFTDTYIWPEAQGKEISGEKISQGLIKRMAFETPEPSCIINNTDNL